MSLYHIAKGPVDYTIVGNPTIVDGVASNLDYSNYCQATSNLVYNYNDNVKMQFKFKTPSSFTGNWASVLSFQSSNDPVISLYSMSNLNIRPLFFNNLGHMEIMYSFDFDTDYILDLEGVSGEWTAKLIKNEVVVSTATLTTNSGSVNTPVFFGRKYRSTSPGISALDLNNTYIKVNGQPWFGVCPVEVKKHQIMGPVGYTVVGSPTITDGVVSGFSNSDYLKITPNLPDINDNDIEVLINAKKLGISGNGYRTIFRCDSFTISLANASALLMTIRTKKSGESSYTTRTTYNWGFVINNDNAKWLKLTKNGNVFSIEGSNDGISYTSGHSYTLEEYEEIQNPATNIFFDQANWGTLGTELFLNSTYIKVNGKLWFYQPAPTKYIIREDKDTHNQSLVFADQGLYLSGPVTYTKVGTPTIVDGVASGFSNDVDTFSALRVYNFDSSQSYHWHIRFQYQAPTNCLIMGNIAKYERPSFLLRTVGLRVSLASDVQLNISNTWIAGNWYEADLEFDGTSEYTLSLSSNNTLIGKTSVSYSTPLSFTTVGIGAVRAGDGVTFNGSIDLNKTYIKVNGSLWFYGKNYATKNIAPVPAGYTYGNTTTQSIGYVDMRTQAFTAAPQGATIGRDE